MPAQAPPTGPKANSRHSSPSLRGPSRGGIQKRGSGAVRVDKDGDLVMDAETGARRGKGRPEGNRLPTGPRGRGSGRGGHMSTPRGSLVTAEAQRSILRGLDSRQFNTVESKKFQKGDFAKRERDTVEIRIPGLKDSKAAQNPDGGVKDLLAFIERKASGLAGSPRGGIRIKKSRRKGDDVIITTSAEDGEWVMKINTFTFAGIALDMEVTSGPTGKARDSKAEEPLMSDAAKETQKRIREILATRYNIELKLLNLSALGQDAGLVKMGMFDAEKRVGKLFPVLMVVCDRLFTSAQQKQDAIISITLADNSLDTVSGVTSLAQTFPDILNLDLSGNQFKSTQSLEGWRRRFPKLQNLKLSRNPIETLEPGYEQDIAKWFPTLQILNETQIRTAEQVEAAISQRKVIESPIPIAAPNLRDINQIGENFLKQFFPSYDTDRIMLAQQLYDSESTFSLSINTSAPRSQDQAATNHSWASYIRNSRNLQKITGNPARMARLHKGTDAIRTLWAELPASKHPDLMTASNKYMIEGHSISGLPDPMVQSPYGVDGMMLTVHGEFEEVATVSQSDLVKRSFSRTFILAPGKPGGPAIRVMSDILILRAYSPLAPVQAAEITPEEVRQKELLQQLMIQTRLTVEYATMCLSETGWDLEKAYAAFEANQAALPPNAFAQSL